MNLTFLQIPSQDRGKKLLTVMGIFWSVGTALSALVGWAVLPSVGWRVFFIASALPSLLLVSLWKHLPESPRYLVLRGRSPEALALFQKIAERNKITLPPKIALLAPQEVGAGVTSGSVIKILGNIRIINWRPHVADWPMLSKTVKLFVIWSINVWSYYGLTFVTPKIARSVLGNESSVYLSILLVTLAELPGLFLVMSSGFICRVLLSVLRLARVSVHLLVLMCPCRLCFSSIGLVVANCSCFCFFALAFHFYA